MNSTRFLHWLAILAVSALLCVGGCAEPGQAARTQTYPVTGTLRVNGAPAAGAMVKFLVRDGAGRMPAAIVREDGSFAASSYASEDGAPAGEYHLLVLWMAPPPEGGLPVDRLQGRFADPNDPVRTITVSTGSNQLAPIELTTPFPLNN